MSGVVDVARSALQKEATQLVNMFRNTLTFTITYSVVAAIVESRVEIVPCACVRRPPSQLARRAASANAPTVLLPSALVVVLATLMIQQAIDERVAKNAHFQKSARMPASSKLLLATKSAVMSISSVAVQFTGNLVALGLSEVRFFGGRAPSLRFWGSLPYAAAVRRSSQTAETRGGCCGLYG
jgi:hypothetical protein